MSSRFTRRFFSSNISVSQLNEVCEGVSLTPVKQTPGDGEHYFPGAFGHVWGVGWSTRSVVFSAAASSVVQSRNMVVTVILSSSLPWHSIAQQILLILPLKYLPKSSLFIPELASVRPPSILAWTNIRDSKPVSLVITAVSHYFVNSPNKCFIAPTLLVRHRAGLVEPSAEPFGSHLSQINLILPQYIDSRAQLSPAFQ